MHLQRVRIPEFRVLKNIDITFEKEFQPRIFPLGSQNGGGKSTLLQLIFVLFHCAGAPERRAYLKNLLKGVKSFQKEEQQTLAEFDIWHNNRIFQLEFLVWNDDYLQKILSEHEQKRIPIELSKYLEQERLCYITMFSSNHEDVESNTLLCRIPDTDTTHIESFLHELSQKVFLTAPSTQVCLFLPQDGRKLLFKKDLEEQGKYSDYLNRAEIELFGFFHTNSLPLMRLSNSASRA
jgi:predicted ATP-dependent endonuclease of OLD family